MLKSVWLKQVIIRFLNDPSSILYQSFMSLSSNIDSEECWMCLYEPEFSGKTYYFINKKSSFETDNVNFLLDNDSIKKLIETKEVVLSGGNTYAPLSFENVSVFGFLVFKDELTEGNSDNFIRSLTAFSYLIFSESSSSIIKSYHDTVIKTDNLCIDYKRGKLVNRVVKNVNIEISEKELTMIFGASGSGKSSILNVLGGMLTASDGKVYYYDQDITNLNDEQRTDYRCNAIGFIFQKYNLISGLTVEENIKIASSLVKNPLSVNEVLEMVGLSGKEKKFPNELSGGEQQRVCIARALVKCSKILLCDEPTGALDSENSLRVMRIIQNIAKERGIPVVVITHNPNLVVLADHSITISNGQVVQDVFQPFPLSVSDLYNK